jgi:DHA2 family methylenomycin A resistance protein-like MFS transporter
MGQITATIAIGSIIFILIEGPRLGWTTPLLFVVYAVFIIATISFVIVERTITTPLIPPRLAAKAGFIGPALLGALFNLAFYGILFVLSLVLQDVKGESALKAGLNFLPLTGLIFVGSLLAPRIARHTGTNNVLYLGQAFMGIGLIATIFTIGYSQPWPLVFSLLPVGFGSGLLVPTMTARMLESLPQDLSGAASASFNTCRQLGGAIGVALFGILFESSTHPMIGFTACLLVSFLCVLASTGVTFFLLGKSRNTKSESNTTR